MPGNVDVNGRFCKLRRAEKPDEWIFERATPRFECAAERHRRTHRVVARHRAFHSSSLGALARALAFGIANS